MTVLVVVGTFRVAVTAMVTGAVPQLKVMTPPLVTAVESALNVQLPVVPLPTTVVGFDTSAGWPPAGIPAEHLPLGFPGIVVPPSDVVPPLDVLPELVPPVLPAVVPPVEVDPLEVAPPDVAPPDVAPLLELVPPEVAPVLETLLPLEPVVPPAPVPPLEVALPPEAAPLLDPAPPSAFDPGPVVDEEVPQAIRHPATTATRTGFPTLRMVIPPEP
jgi:hypothetical protein